ncbi:hypothetical protein Dimus_000255 [Dionaea muscipula]
MKSKLSLRTIVISLILVLLATVFYYYVMSRPREVYLVDYVCYKPPKSYHMTLLTLVEQNKMHMKHNYQEAAVEFVRRMVERSGLGQETHMPPATHLHCPTLGLNGSHVESQTTIFTTIDSSLERTGFHPQDIDILVVNSGLYSPTPSLTAMIVNKYKLRAM